MAKNPEAGKVKTRLSRDIGKEKALEAYIHLLDKTLQSIVQVKEAEYFIYHSPEIIEAAEWIPTNVHHALQSDGDLGQRMSTAIHEILKSFDEVIVIGADCAGLTSGHLQKAIDKLNIVDVVLGPSEDGGYYLIGMKTPHDFLFKGMEWSHPKVYHQTLDRLTQNAKSVFILEELYDIDHQEDWNRYQNQN